jgi:hypothetical protein
VTPRPFNALRPLDMQQLVRCLEKRFGPVDLLADEGLTRLRVAGVALNFLEAERLCLGETSLEELTKAAL